MAYFESYKQESIKPRRVPHDGDYLCMVIGVKFGNTKDGARYTQITCKIKSDGEPRVSLFLTEGDNFNAKATAFYDTFGIDRGNENTKSWIGKKGYLHIALVQKDGYTNMQPSYILNEDGYVCQPGHEDDVTPEHGDDGIIEDIPF